jgi:arginine deiminase
VFASLRSQIVPVHYLLIKITDKERIDAERSAVLDELVAQAQELGMGYD